MKKNGSPFFLVHASEAALSFALLVIAVIFSAFPEALEHAPVGFETRGIIHHIFHYTLLAGALLSFVGLVLERPRTEMVGLFFVIGALLMNLLALATGGGEDAKEGLTYAVRGGVILGLVGRLYLIAVYLPRLARQGR